MRQVFNTKFIIRNSVLLGVIAYLVTGGAPLASEDQRGPRVMGWVENVRLYPGDLKIAAKLDTGARTSSVDVSKFEVFWRNGEKWIRFQVGNRNGSKLEFERPVVRTARVRRSQTKTVRRPVVMMGLCIGTLYREVEVNLAMRSHLNYAMLIGRTSMQGIVIDASRKFTAEPACRSASDERAKR